MFDYDPLWNMLERKGITQYHLIKRVWHIISIKDPISRHELQNLISVKKR